MAKKTTKVMWASKHEPEQAQLRELRRLFGEDVAVDNYPNRIQGGQELYRILISQNYDELVLVAPERVFIYFSERAVCPLRSVGVSPNGIYSFHHFVRVVKTELVTYKFLKPISKLI